MGLSKDLTTEHTHLPDLLSKSRVVPGESTEKSL